MFDVDVDQFRIKKPWRDAAFWLALLSGLGTLFGPPILAALADYGITTTQLAVAVAPVMGYLYLNGFVRGRSVTALGYAVGQAATAPELMPLLEQNVEVHPPDEGSGTGVKAPADGGEPFAAEAM